MSGNQHLPGELGVGSVERKLENQRQNRRPGGWGAAICRVPCRSSRTSRRAERFRTHPHGEPWFAGKPDDNGGEPERPRSPHTLAARRPTAIKMSRTCRLPLMDDGVIPANALTTKGQRGGSTGPGVHRLAARSRTARLLRTATRSSARLRQAYDLSTIAMLSLAG